MQNSPRFLSVISVLAFLTFVLLDVPVAVALTPAHFWSQRYGSTLADVGTVVGVDASGNVIVAGQFVGTVSFGGANLVSNGGSTDIFLAKYTSNGAHVWSKAIGGTGVERPNSLALDGSGNIVIAGYFFGATDLGGGTLTSAGGQDIFLAKYNSNGTHVWSRRFGDVTDDSGNGVDIDGSGNVFLTGSFSGTVDFGGGGLVSSLGSLDVVLAKYDSGGVHQWSQRFGSTGVDGGTSVALDASSNVFVTGSFQGTVNFGGSGLTTAGFDDVFLAKYDSGGGHHWSQRFGGSGVDVGATLATDASGDVILGAYFYDTVNFGGGNLVSAGIQDIALAKYNAGGVHQWSQRQGGTGSDSPFAVAVNESDDIFLTGQFAATVDFGGGGITSAGGQDIFLAKYDAGGLHQWSRGFGQSGTDRGRGIATSGIEFVVATGDFQGTVSFGGSSLASSGAEDVFLMKYGADWQEPVIQSITDIGNDQGRMVKIRFSRSGYDVPGAPSLIVRYEAFRRDDPPPAEAQASSNPAGFSTLRLLDEGWTQVGSISSHGTTGYGMDVPTIGDSTITLGQYYSYFFVRAASSSPFIFYDSPVDSGYSLDNLAPGVPTGFAFATGQLSWNESMAPDFDYFTVYGSDADNFGAATVVDYSVAPSMDVSGSPYVFYFVTATDFSGNEGQPAKINTLSGAGGPPRSYVLSVTNYPNPFNPRTTVKYTVPSRGRVTIAVYDLRGAHVATLFQGERAAGAYDVEWGGRADTGSVVSSGVYFAHVEHASGVRTKKMVLLK